MQSSAGQLHTPCDQSSSEMGEQLQEDRDDERDNELGEREEQGGEMGETSGNQLAVSSTTQNSECGT